MPARDRIQGAAVELMAKKGVAGTTTQDIARRARCSQAAIYKYWESKDGLARECFNDAHARLMEDLDHGVASRLGATERVRGVLRTFLEFARSRPAEYAFLFQVFHSDYARWLASLPMPRDIVVREIERGVAAGELPPGNANVKAAMLLGMTIRLAFFERQRLVGNDPSAVSDQLDRAVAALLAL